MININVELDKEATIKNVTDDVFKLARQMDNIKVTIQLTLKDNERIEPMHKLVQRVQRFATNIYKLDVNDEEAIAALEKIKVEFECMQARGEFFIKPHYDPVSFSDETEVFITFAREAQSKINDLVDALQGN